MSTTTHHTAQQGNKAQHGFVTPRRTRVLQCPGAPRGRRLGFPSGSPGVSPLASPLVSPLASPTHAASGVAVTAATQEQ